VREWVEKKAVGSSTAIHEPTSGQEARDDKGVFYATRASVPLVFLVVLWPAGWLRCRLNQYIHVDHFQLEPLDLREFGDIYGRRLGRYLRQGTLPAQPQRHHHLL
jgi:hypothetical protein